MKRMIRSAGQILLILAAIGILAACQREETAQPARQGRITATDAYQTHFGKAPTPLEGTCFAMVGYLPKENNPSKVVPLPLFLFKEQDRMRLLIERLITVDEGASARIGVTNPFPPGASLTSLKQEGNLVRIELADPGNLPSDEVQWQAILNSLGHSLLQFPGVGKILVTVGGAPLHGQPQEGFSPDLNAVSSPGKPTIIGVVGSWEKAGHGPEEVSVFFDRPIAIEEIRLTGPDGNDIEGEYFQSIFDMAVVVHPKFPAAISEGMLIRVAWKAKDHKGRSGQGEQGFHLARLDHP